MKKVLKDSNIKDTQNEEVENYPELGFLEVLIYSSIPYIHGLPLIYIACRDLINGKEPFYGSTSPITKAFAYLVTIGITGPMYLVHKLVKNEKILDRLVEFKNDFVKEVKRLWNKVLGREKKEIIIDMEPVEEVEQVERPKLLKRKSLSLTDIDKYFDKITDCDSINKSKEVEARRIQPLENLLKAPKSKGMDLQF